MYISSCAGSTRQITQLTRLQDGMMPLGKITKQQRKQERLHLGKLEDLVVKKATLAKYHLHFNRFFVWAESNELNLQSLRISMLQPPTLLSHCGLIGFW